MNENKNELVHKELSYQIVGAAMEVHNTLGAGFLEKVYENALMIALRKREMRCAQQAPIKVLYEGQVVGDYYADILVEEKVILEILRIAQRVYLLRLGKVALEGVPEELQRGDALQKAFLC